MKAEYITYSPGLKQYILWMYYGDVERFPIEITQQQFDVIYQKVGFKDFQEKKSLFTYTLKNLFNED